MQYLHPWEQECTLMHLYTDFKLEIRRYKKGQKRNSSGLFKFIKSITIQFPHGSMPHQLGSYRSVHTQ